jgi:chromosome segregation ATPase
LITVAGLGLLLSVGSLIGVWVAKPPVTEVSVATMHTAESYLALASNMMAATEGQISEMRTQLSGLSARIDAMNAENRVPIAEQVVGTVQSQLAPTVARLRATMSLLHGALVALNQLLISANTIPGVSVPTLSMELQTAEQRLGEIQANLTALADAAATVSFDGNQLKTAIDSTAAQLASLTEVLAQYRAQIITLRASVTSLGEATPGIIDLSSVVLSIFFVVWAAGQVCMIQKALTLFRPRT